ncbi:hypothetical protein GGF46_003699 [Coemansia sp. RSA 552]|nr:hypothetical protein GGF46_003699 [Coemansia sp. RSA 552]
MRVRAGRCRVLGAVAAFGACALGCGPAVHNEVAERARQWLYELPGIAPSDERLAIFRGILDRHPEALQAGAVFPDWGYGCMSMDDEAEAAHWTPFLEYGLEYFLSRYSDPARYSPHAQRLAAFLFGVASHQVADEQWHSLSGLREGFMRVLAESTFNGEFSRAHDVLDVGGDFALAHMSDLSNLRDKWTVPSDDIIAIYHRMGFRISQWRMNICIKRLFYAMQAVKRFGRGLFPSYASRAPMLTERLDDYYLGGLYAMSTATNECWRTMVDWFGSGNFTQKCLVDDRRYDSYRHGHSRLSALDLPPSWIQQIRTSVSVVESDGLAYAGFGASTAAGDFDGSGSTSVAIGSPYYRPGPYDTQPVSDSGAGAVFIVNTTEVPSAFSQQNILHADPLILRPQTSAPRFPRFGSSLAVVDFNADGIDDLVVGSSAYGNQPDGPLLGRVDIYLGSHTGLSTTPDYTLTAEQLAMYMSSPWSHQRIGEFLFGEDVNGDGFTDLVIGAPYHSDVPYERHSGRVFGYIARKDRVPSSGHMGPPDFSLVSPARQPFEWFGFSARAVRLGPQNSTVLLVGAPGHKVDGPDESHPLAGRIYAFSMNNTTAPTFTGLEFGTHKAHTQLGSQIHVWEDKGRGPWVLFGSPSEHNGELGQGAQLGPSPPSQPLPARGWQAGEVRVVDPAQWAQADHQASDLDEEMVGLIDTLRGVQSPGHFGRALAAANAELWIGEPFSDMEGGRIYRWRKDTQLPACFLMPGGAGSQARFGQLVTAAQGGRTLLAAAPHDSQFSRFSGSIMLLR